MRLVSPFRHSLPINESLFRQPVYLTQVGWEKVGAGAPYWELKLGPEFYKWDEVGGRVLPEFCLVLVVAGGGELQVGDRRRPWEQLRAGDAFFYRPGEWHRHRPFRDTGWTAMWIHFNGDAPLQWMREGCFQLQGNFPLIENRALFRAQLEYLIECVHRNPASNSMNLCNQAIGLLAHFLSDASVDPTDEPADMQPSAVQAATEYIWSFGHGPLDVSTVSNAVGVARRTLERQFKSATGRSILEEIQFCRVSRAARLLQETSLPVKNIVDRAGFRSSEHMRLALQKAFGKSAQAFRRGAEIDDR